MKNTKSYIKSPTAYKQDKNRKYMKNSNIFLVTEY